MFSTARKAPSENQPGIIDALIDEGVDRFSGALRSGKFGFITNHKFGLGKALLIKLRTEEISDEDKLQQFGYIVVGTVSFAMAAESSKYHEFGTPLSGYQLSTSVDSAYEQKARMAEHDQKLRETFDSNAELSAIFVAVGKKVLVDKTLPVFPEVALFMQHGVSIQNMLALKLEAIKLMSEKSPRCGM